MKYIVETESNAPGFQEALGSFLFTTELADKNGLSMINVRHNHGITCAAASMVVVPYGVLKDPDQLRRYAQSSFTQNAAELESVIAAACR